jgi:hypothetical protein
MVRLAAIAVTMASVLAIVAEERWDDVDPSRHQSSTSALVSERIAAEVVGSLPVASVAHTPTCRAGQLAIDGVTTKVVDERSTTTITLLNIGGRCTLYGRPELQFHGSDPDRPIAVQVNRVARPPKRVVLVADPAPASDRAAQVTFESDIRRSAEWLRSTHEVHRVVVRIPEVRDEVTVVFDEPIQVPAAVEVGPIS